MRRHFFTMTMMRVDAVGNRAVCGFPSLLWARLRVHRDGSAHALWHSKKWCPEGFSRIPKENGAPSRGDCSTVPSDSSLNDELGCR